MRLLPLTIALTWRLAFGQAPSQATPPPAFEVATVKPAAPNQPGSGMNFGRGMAKLNNVTLRQAILYAFSLRDYQLSGGPKWASSEAFDIVGKAASTDALPESIRNMLCALLVERFHLDLRKEIKPLPAYSLEAAKGGVKLAKAAPDEPGGTSSGREMLKAQNIDMRAIADLIASKMGRPVVDRTNAEGRFDFVVHFAADNAAADSTLPSFVTALQEQCGLRLQTTTAPGETFVIEKAERPSDN
jgi:uncharacterized protein (TIGR03435 family)